jgi:hypothetical protein
MTREGKKGLIQPTCELFLTQETRLFTNSTIYFINGIFFV